jgi:hypothetical protein
MEDPELCIEQQSLLYPSASVDYDDDNKSKNKPAKMLSSYRGRRRLVVLSVAVAVTLGIVVVWGPFSSSVEEEGTSHRLIHRSFVGVVHGGIVKNHFLCRFVVANLILVCKGRTYRRNGLLGASVNIHYDPTASHSSGQL